MSDFKQRLASRLVGSLTGEKVVAGESPKKKPKKAPKTASSEQSAETEPTAEVETEEVRPEDMPPDFGQQMDASDPKTTPLEGVTTPDLPDIPDGLDSDDEESEEEDEVAKKSKRKRWLIIGGAALVCVLMLVFIFGNIARGARASINLMDAVDIRMEENVSGYGQISPTINAEKLSQLIADSKAYIPQNETATSVAEKIVEAAQVEASKTKGIANGDEILISVTVPPELANIIPGMDLKSGQAKWTAANMPEGKLVDAFGPGSINLRVEGNSGAANAYLDILAKGAHVYYLNYDWSPKTGLKNGDTVIVTINPMESKLSELGYVAPKERSWEYMVGGLDELVNNTSDIPNTFLNSMVSHAEAELAKDFQSVPIAEGQDIVVTQPEITSIYFLDKADKSTPYSDWFNGLQMSNGIAVLGHFFVQDVEPTEVINEDGSKTVKDEVVQTYGGYYVWIFPDMVRHTGGDYGYNQTMITKRTTSYQTENDCVAWMKGEFKGFAVTKIGSNPAA